MKLISLFDGSGGFPLAGAMCGITPIVASEIEPYPIAVTKSRFPNMIHLGDVSKVNGADLEPADIITFGSPCQDLSVAGRRAGLKHEANGDEETTRSGLFMEAIRIIKEMREVTDGKYPRYAVWENVPGAFSSNKGEDFRVVLEEFVRICEPGAEMPAVPKGKWPYADVILGDGWSIAYRTLDAQYWGVPQRRRRIYLVADLRGQRAPKILFERDGLRGNSPKSGTQREDTAGAAEDSVGATDREGAVAIENHPNDSRVDLDESGTVQTLTGRMGTGGGNVPLVMEQKEPVYCLQGNGIDRAETAGCNGKGWREDASYTLNTIDRPAVAYALDQQGGKGGANYAEEVMPTLCSDSHGTPHAVAYGIDRAAFNQGINAQYAPQFDVEKSATIVAKGPNAVCYATGNGQADNSTVSDTFGALDCMHDQKIAIIGYEEQEKTYIVRRLTPTECARLQGFPDWWGEIDHKEDLTDEEYEFWLNVRNTMAAINGKAVKDYTKEQMLKWYNKLHTDSAEYKMWGNGIALPCALYVMQGIVQGDE